RSRRASSCDTCGMEPVAARRTGVCRNCDDHGQPFSWRRFDVKRSLRAIARGDAVANDVESHPTAGPDIALGPRPVVPDLDLQRVAGGRGAQIDRSAAGTWRYPVLDGVLDERLQGERWNRAVESLGIDLLTHAEPLAQTQLFQGEVVTHELQLVGETHVLA